MGHFAELCRVSFILDIIADTRDRSLKANEHSVLDYTLRIHRKSNTVIRISVERD